MVWGRRLFASAVEGKTGDPAGQGSGERPRRIEGKRSQFESKVAERSLNDTVDTDDLTALLDEMEGKH